MWAAGLVVWYRLWVTVVRRSIRRSPHFIDSVLSFAIASSQHEQSDPVVGQWAPGIPDWDDDCASTIQSLILTWSYQRQYWLTIPCLQILIGLVNQHAQASQEPTNGDVMGASATTQQKIGDSYDQMQGMCESTLLDVESCNLLCFQQDHKIWSFSILILFCWRSCEVGRSIRS